jgi:dolichol-phosphate mannosyltransferase
VIHLVVPAYNEAPNIPRLLAGLEPVAKELGARLIVVDDGSTDGTAALLRAHVNGLPVDLVSHDRNRGLGAAVRTGLDAAIAAAADDDAVVTLEADTTSNLGDLPRMLERFREGHDVVLASVHAPGGHIVGVSGWRIFLSRSVSNLFRYAGGLRDVHTVSALYRVYRAGTLRRASEVYGELLVREQGFAVNVELLLKLRAIGARVCEVPTTNDWTTRAGNSKLRAAPTARAYVRVLLDHLVDRMQPVPEAAPGRPNGAHR